MKSLEESVVSVIGLGLLGASLAWRLASRSAARGVAGWSRNPATVEAAAARGMITRACASAEECASLGDVIVLAVPVRSMLELSRIIVKSARRDAAVFDLGSTKREIGASLTALWGDRYAGFHPMAGREKGGLENADLDLFVDAVCAVVPFPAVRPEVLSLAGELARALGGRPFLVGPEEHDAAAGCVSHLPVLLSAALSLLAGRERENNPSVAMLAAGGFRDCTRVAAGPAWLGADMVTGNYQQLRRLAEEFKDILGELLSASPVELESRLSEAGAAREALLQAKKEWSRAR